MKLIGETHVVFMEEEQGTRPVKIYAVFSNRAKAEEIARDLTEADSLYYGGLPPWQVKDVPLYEA